MEKRKQNDAFFEKKRHGDIGFPMNVYWNDFTTYVAESIPWHWHEEIEFAVVTQGTVEISVGTMNLQMKAGEGIFINADTLHQMKPVGEEKAYMFTIVAHPCILGIEKGFLISSKYVTPFIGSDTIKGLLLQKEVSWQKEILTYLQNIYDAYTKKKYGYEYKLHNLLCEIWFLMVENAWGSQEEDITYKPLDETRIYQALEYIQSHYMEALTLEDICESINISKSECCRCFQRNLRMTPFEYLMIHRISEASHLLRKTDQTVTEIAIATGFNSSSYFCKIFKKYMNTSPMEYRKNRNI